jgi:hypothetical protein
VLQIAGLPTTGVDQLDDIERLIDEVLVVADDLDAGRTG